MAPLIFAHNLLTGTSRFVGGKQTYARVLSLSAEGLRGIAERLNDDGQTTRRGKAWNAVQVSRVLERAAA